MNIKYTLHINDSGQGRDTKTFEMLGSEIPLKTGQHYKEFDIDIDRLTDKQKVAYEKLHKWMAEKYECDNPHLPLGTDLSAFKKGWKLEVVE